MLFPRARYFTLECIIWLRENKVPGRTEMTMCPIISKGRDGGRTLREVKMGMNRSSEQGLKCKVG